MPVTQAELVLDPVVAGDTWTGIPSIQTVIDGNPPTEDLAFARIQFRKQWDSRPAGATLDTDNGGIAISDASTWLVVVPPQKLPLAPGLWRWDYETTDAAGTVKTFMYGTLTVLEDISRGRACV